MENMKCSEGKLPALNPTKLENLKFRITSPKQSERLQKILFELGYEWYDGKENEFCHTHNLFLYAEYIEGEVKGFLGYGDSEDFFYEFDKCEECDTEAFIAQHTTVTVAENVQPSIDKHYSFDYKLTEDDIKKGSIKIDPYFVSQEWQLGAKDNTGVIFHCLKTLARFSVKNSKEREITALYKQIVRLAELEGITLG